MVRGESGRGVAWGRIRLARQTARLTPEEGRGGGVAGYGRGQRSPLAQVEVEIAALVDVLDLDERGVLVLVHLAPAMHVVDTDRSGPGRVGGSGAMAQHAAGGGRSGDAGAAQAAPLVAEDTALAVQCARLAILLLRGAR